MWKGTIIKVSDIDSGGSVDVVYDIYDDSKSNHPLYPSMIASGLVEEIIGKISTVIAELKQKNTTIQSVIKVGMEIIV